MAGTRGHEPDGDRHYDFYKTIIKTRESGDATTTEGWEFLKAASFAYKCKVGEEDWLPIITGDERRGRPLGKDAVIYKVQPRNTFNLAIRGTFNEEAADVQWLGDRGNLFLGMTQHPKCLGRRDVQVHKGFLTSYQSFESIISTQIQEACTRARINTINITGHSRGGALATLCAFDLAERHRDMQVRVVVWASPRVGNEAFADVYRRIPNLVHTSFANSLDVVPQIPPAVLGKVVGWAAPAFLGEEMMTALEEGYMHVLEPIILDPFEKEQFTYCEAKELYMKWQDQAPKPLTLRSFFSGAKNICEHDMDKYETHYRNFFVEAPEPVSPPPAFIRFGKSAPSIARKLYGGYSYATSKVAGRPSAVSPAMFQERFRDMQDQGVAINRRVEKLGSDILESISDLACLPPARELKSEVGAVHVHFSDGDYEAALQAYRNCIPKMIYLRDLMQEVQYESQQPMLLKTLLYASTELGWVSIHKDMLSRTKFLNHVSYMEPVPKKIRQLLPCLNCLQIKDLHFHLSRFEAVLCPYLGDRQVGPIHVQVFEALAECDEKLCELDPELQKASKKRAETLRLDRLNSLDWKRAETFRLNRLKSLDWIRSANAGGRTLDDGKFYTEQECYLEALRLDPQSSHAWNELGRWGGTVDGKLYTKKECFIEAIRHYPRSGMYHPWTDNRNQSIFWVNLGIEGGGRVGGREYTEKQCFEEVIRLNPQSIQSSDAWCRLGEAGDVTVDGRRYTRMECYSKALQDYPPNSRVWFRMSEEGGGTVDGQFYTRQECSLESLRLDPTSCRAWDSFGVSGGGTVGGNHYTPSECCIEALRHYPQYSLSWYRLGKHGGGTVDGTLYTKKECYIEAVRLNPSARHAWRSLGHEGGGTVDGRTYTKEECCAKGAERKAPTA